MQNYAGIFDPTANLGIGIPRSHNADVQVFQVFQGFHLVDVQDSIYFRKFELNHKKFTWNPGFPVNGLLDSIFLPI